MSFSGWGTAVVQQHLVLFAVIFFSLRNLILIRKKVPNLFLLFNSTVHPLWGSCKPAPQSHCKICCLSLSVLTGSSLKATYMDWGSHLTCLLGKLPLTPLMFEHVLQLWGAPPSQCILEWVQSAHQSCWPQPWGLHRLSVAPFALARGRLHLWVWELWISPQSLCIPVCLASQEPCCRRPSLLPRSHSWLSFVLHWRESVGWLWQSMWKKTPGTKGIWWQRLKVCHLLPRQPQEASERRVAIEGELAGQGPLLAAGACLTSPRACCGQAAWWIRSEGT